MFRIQFVPEEEPDRLWLTQVLFAAVAHGIRFNSGRYRGTYRIFPKPGPTDYTEKMLSVEDIDRTELLADAIEIYSRYDAGVAELGISTTYTAAQPELPVSIQVLPRGGKTCFLIDTNESDIEDGTHFREFLTLPMELFERFNFRYGGSVVGDQIVPVSEEEVYADHPRHVTFYPPEMVEKIGREKLLSAPAATVTELHDGSIFLLMSESPLGAGAKTYNAIKEHLSE